MSAEPAAASSTTVHPARVRAERRAVLALADRHGLRGVRVFARGDGAGLLVDLGADREGFDLVNMEADLERLLGGHVDVVSSGALRNDWDNPGVTRAEPL